MPGGVRLFILLSSSPESLADTPLCLSPGPCGWRPTWLPGCCCWKQYSSDGCVCVCILTCSPPDIPGPSETSGLSRAQVLGWSLHRSWASSSRCCLCTLSWSRHAYLERSKVCSFLFPDHAYLLLRLFKYFTCVSFPSIVKRVSWWCLMGCCWYGKYTCWFSL